MSESTDATAMSEWVTAVAQQLGLDGPVGNTATVDMILGITGDVAHAVDRPAAPVTAFLIGVAAGRADDPAVAARDYAEKIRRLAKGWGSDSERGMPANEQELRA